MTSEKKVCEYLSPLRLSLLVVNGICFGGFVMLILLGKSNVFLIVMTASTGLMLFAGLAGALLASRCIIKQKHNLEHQK